MQEETKKLYLAVVLSILVVLFTNQFMAPEQPIEPNAGAIIADAVNDAGVSSTLPKPDVAVNAAAEEEAVMEEVREDVRLPIVSDALNGSLRLTGVRIDDLVLPQYREELDENSSPVRLFSPSGDENAYYAEFGWVAAGVGGVKVPDSNTVWKTDHKGEIKPNTPVKFYYDNGEGLLFTKTLVLDDKYMFAITEEVENKTDKVVALHHFGLISHSGRSRNTKRGPVHEGPVGVISEKLEEVSYDDVLKSGERKYNTTGGWVGITDSFWLSALAFDQTMENVTVRYLSTGTEEKEKFQADFLTPPLKVEVGKKRTVTSLLFAGAKEVRTLDAYRDKFGIEKFDLAIDFGWYYFLTKPFFFVLDYLYKLLGNMGLAILCFATILRGVMFPVAQKSQVNMAKMKKLQPKVNELHERFDHDKVRLQQELMDLYKREQVNPAAGCLPMFIQIPVFFSLYKVLNIAIEIRHAPFYGWIKDLSAPDPTSVFTLFGYVPWPVPDFLNIGFWPLVMGLTMVTQQILSPKPADKSQAMMMNVMPIVFTFMLGHFAAGLVIYWTWSNILSIIQQRVIMYKLGVKVWDECKPKTKS